VSLLFCGDDKLTELLQRLRSLIGRPIIITSGYRCPKHDREVGGPGTSFHTKGLAADFYVPGVPLDQLKELNALALSTVS